MRIALGVHRVATDPATNLGSLDAMAIDAAANGAELVVFSEASLTGFIGTGDPNRDRGLSETIPARQRRRCARLHDEPEWGSPLGCTKWTAISGSTIRLF